jgi:hypothetical protein
MDDECPDLCPVRHLLVYLYFSGIVGGYIFPTESILKEDCTREQTKSCSKHLSYSTLSKIFVRMAKEVLTAGSTVHLKLGLHTLRKTAYRFAIWGNGIWSVIKNDARHIMDADAFRYAGDAFSSMQIAHIFNDPMNKVKKYKATKCLSPTVSAYETAESTAAGVALPKLATEYIMSLGVAECLQKDFRIVLDKAITAKPSTPSSTLFQELEEALPDSYKKLLHEALSAQCLEQRLEAQKKLADSSSIITTDPKKTSSKRPPPEQHSTEESENQPEQKKQRRKAGNIDLDGRENFVSFTLHEKLQWLQQLKVPETRDLTNPARTFVMRTHRPIMKCLKSHHNNNMDAFCQSWEGRFKIKFGENCCKGEGQSCTFNNNNN